MIDGDTYVDIKRSTEIYKVNITNLSRRLEVQNSLNPENPFCSIIRKNNLIELENCSSEFLNNVSKFSISKTITCKKNNFLNPINFQEDYQNELKKYDLEIIHVLNPGECLKEKNPILYAGKYGLTIWLTYFKVFDINDKSQIAKLISNLSRKEFQEYSESFLDIVNYDLSQLPDKCFMDVNFLKVCLQIMNDKIQTIYNRIISIPKNKTTLFLDILNPKQLSQLLLNESVDKKYMIQMCSDAHILNLDTNTFKIVIESLDKSRISRIVSERKRIYKDISDLESFSIEYKMTLEEKKGNKSYDIQLRNIHEDNISIKRVMGRQNKQNKINTDELLLKEGVERSLLDTYSKINDKTKIDSKSWESTYFDSET